MDEEEEEKERRRKRKKRRDLGKKRKVGFEACPYNNGGRRKGDREDEGDGMRKRKARPLLPFINEFEQIPKPTPIFWLFTK